jgi:hypothetical protein
MPAIVSAEEVRSTISTKSNLRELARWRVQEREEAKFAEMKMERARWQHGRMLGGGAKPKRPNHGALDILG